MPPPTDQSKLFTLYGLKRPDENVIRYIGITSMKLARRLSQHRSDGHNPEKDFWIDEMFPQRPEIIPYSTGLTLEEACDLEIFVIGELRRLNHKLFNISVGGTLAKLGHKCSPETKRKISEGNRGHTRNIGTKRTPEVCAEMSEIQRGNTKGRGNRGKVRSPENREKISRSVRAWWKKQKEIQV